MKFSSNVEVNMCRFTQSDFWFDIIISRWQPWCHLTQKSAAAWQENTKCVSACTHMPMPVPFELVSFTHYHRLPLFLSAITYRHYLLFLCLIVQVRFFFVPGSNYQHRTWHLFLTSGEVSGSEVAWNCRVMILSVRWRASMVRPLWLGHR